MEPLRAALIPPAARRAEMEPPRRLRVAAIRLTAVAPTETAAGQAARAGQREPAARIERGQRGRASAGAAVTAGRTEPTGKTRRQERAGAERSPPRVLATDAPTIRRAADAATPDAAAIRAEPLRDATRPTRALRNRRAASCPPERQRRAASRRSGLIHRQRERMIRPFDANPRSRLVPSRRAAKVRPRVLNRDRERRPEPGRSEPARKDSGGEDKSKGSSGGSSSPQPGRRRG